MTRRLFLLPLLILTFRALPQTRDPGETFTIAGHVRNVHSGEPVPRALVLVHGKGRGQPVVSLHALTDPGGTFRVSGLAGGLYTVEAQKPHFEAVSEPRPSPIQLGPSREDVELRLSPLGAIEGTVLDSGGAPLKGVNIQALRIATRDGWRQVEQERSVGTDDRGRYRMWNLQPGRYYMKAAGHYGGVREFRGETAPVTEWDESVVPAYAGGAPSLETAEPLVLKQRASQEANFRLETRPAFRIRGTLVDYDPAEPVKFELLSGEEGHANRSSFNSASGQFVINDVIPGSYRLRATQSGRSSETGLRIGDQDMTGLKLALFSSVPVSSTPHCEQDERRCVAYLSFYDEFRKEQGYGSLPPGQYRLSVFSSRGYGETVSCSGNAIPPGGSLVVPPGSGPVTCDIYVKTGGAVDVSVELDGQPKSISVLLVPDTESFVAPYRGFETGGKWTFRNLAPGEYSLYAFRDLDEIEYRNPEAMRKFKPGAKVTIRANSREQAIIRSLSQ